MNEKSALLADLKSGDAADCSLWAVAASGYAVLIGAEEHDAVLQNVIVIDDALWRMTAGGIVAVSDCIGTADDEAVWGDFEIARIPDGQDFVPLKEEAETVFAYSAGADEDGIFSRPAESFTPQVQYSRFPVRELAFYLCGELIEGRHGGRRIRQFWSFESVRKECRTGPTGRRRDFCGFDSQGSRPLRGLHPGLFSLPPYGRLLRIPLIALR